MFTKEEILEKLQGGLIVSCQALEDEPLYMSDQTIMPMMAYAAQSAHATGIRANGTRDIQAIKKKVTLPLIGIIKRHYQGTEQFITATMAEVEELVKAEADIIAFDATQRQRQDGRSLDEFVKEIKSKYPKQLLMADISTCEEGILAEAAGVDFVGTTLSGYTSYSRQQAGPDLELISELAGVLKIPIVAEGRIHYPEQARVAIEAGAFAVVVGGAITRPQEIIGRFMEQITKVKK